MRFLLCHFVFFRSKNHYGDLFQKAQYDKEQLRKQRAKKEGAQNVVSQEALMYMIFGLAGLFIVLVVNGTDDYDQVKIKKNDSDRTD